MSIGTSFLRRLMSLCKGVLPHIAVATDAAPMIRNSEFFVAK
jgi:hypothetical protein